MMGTGHATSGALVWGIGCAAATGLGHRPSLFTAAVGALVCAGWALAPDIDHPGSTVARCGGWVTRILAVGFGSFGALVHARTKTQADRPDLDGHRTLSHTAVWALFSGLVVVAAQLLWPHWTMAVVVFMAVHVGLIALLPGRWKRFWVQLGRRRGSRVTVSTPLGVALLLAVVVYQQPAGRGWWLGVAVALGSLVHCLGDCLTDSRCPILWPIPIVRDGRRLRWCPIGPPRRYTFSAGGPVERLLVQPAMTTLLIATVLLLVWPR